MKAYFNEQPLEIYEAIVYPAPYLRKEIGMFVNFRILKKGVLKIECDTAPESVVIRPKRFGLTAKINGNIFEIPIDKPCNFSVEPNGNIIGGLMVFANGKNDIKTSDYENIIKFERTLADESFFENGAAKDFEEFKRRANIIVYNR